MGILGGVEIREDVAAAEAVDRLLRIADENQATGGRLVIP
jgi:hypothetical protein